MRPGSYRLHFSPDWESPYADEYFDNANWDDAQLVTVASDPVAGIDAELATKAMISGRVIGPDGEPLADVSVYASDEMTLDGGYATTDTDGNYQLLVRPGSYRLHFSPDWESPYVDEYFDNAASWDDAQLVNVTGDPVAGVDAELALPTAAPSVPRTCVSLPVTLR